MRFALLAAAAFGLSGIWGSVAAQPLDKATYDPSIPTFLDVLGYDVGEEISAPNEAIDYLEALQAAAPDRIKLFPYANSWEGRPLIYAVIADPSVMARLDDIKADLAALASGELVETEREAIIAETPAVTWLAYSVHGDEISPTDGALGLAYHLLAAEDDPRVQSIREQTIVIIDPMQNPDGRARFVQSFKAARGLEPQGDPASAERDQPWPGGRLNHALFDLNRDWFTLSQPETRGKIASILEWNPVVLADVHEMGTDSTYYFPPAARPFNPYIREGSRDGQEIIGRMIASAFDDAGEPYFIREIFDQLYPGYGDTWPAFGGATALTFEQASARGLVGNRSDGTQLTYRETVDNQFLSSLMTAYAVAENKDRFLRVFAETRTSAIARGRASTSRFTVIDLAKRRGQAEALGRRLAAQGIDVLYREERATFCRKEHPEGALIIDRAQPQGDLIATLLELDTPMAEDFVEEQEERRNRGLPAELYDITAWSLPLMNDVSVVSCNRIGLDGTVPLTAATPPMAKLANEAAFGYAVPWDDKVQAQLVVAALKAGLVGKTTDKDFTQGGRVFPRGSVVFTNALNTEQLGDQLNEIAASIGAEVVGMPESWTESGPTFGSGSFTRLEMPKVALAWGEGVGPLSAGAFRYVAERELGIPITPIRVRSMGFADLDAYDVVVIPHTRGSFSAILGDGGAANLEAFVSGGGVVVGLGHAVSTLSSEGLGLLPLTRENAVQGDDVQDEADGPIPGTELESREDYASAIADPEARPDYVPGVLVRADANENHFLSSGYTEAITPFAGNTIYTPMRGNDGINVFTYQGADDLLASGYLWEDVRTQLAFKPLLVAAQSGEGMAIGYTQDPATRAYLHGLTLMLANSLVLAPAYTD
ncbi:MAG: M14 family zinc carboxypeptidase [Pseudomonadota bacterium]